MAYVVHKRFGYEQAHVSILPRGTLHSVPATSIEREFVEGLEKQLIEAADDMADNKTVFIFSNTNRPWVMHAVCFYDQDATFVTWYPRHWGNRVPANIMINQPRRPGMAATAKDLNIPENRA